MTRPAVEIIKREHRSMSRVIHALKTLLERARREGEADFALLAGALEYVEDFPQTFHHPKEDAHLFRLLRARTDAADALIDKLEQEHRIDQALMVNLRARLQDWFESGAPESTAFASLVAEYASFYCHHMKTEETELLPLAQQYLTDADWAEVDRVFLAHEDPLFGDAPREDFLELLEFICGPQRQEAPR